MYMCETRLSPELPSVEAVTGLPGVEWSRYARAEQLPYQRDLNSATFKGSYGTVFRATNMSGESFAIEELHAEQTRQRNGSTNLISSTESEIQLLRKCKHRNILKYIDAYILDSIPNTIFLVTQPWAPISIVDLLRDVNKDGKSSICPWWNEVRPFEKCYRLFVKLLEALAYLHSHSIMHKDINPKNILFHGSIPVIADFGISKIYRSGALTEFTKSTVEYLAPEQIAHIASNLNSDVLSWDAVFSYFLRQPLRDLVGLTWSSKSSKNSLGRVNTAEKFTGYCLYWQP